MIPRSEVPDCEAVEIDRIRREYARREQSIAGDFYSWRHPANYFQITQIVRACIRTLIESGLYPLNGRRVADIGCGRGCWLLEFAQWGADPADLAGIDLDETRVARARSALPSADIRSGNAACLPWPDQSFDVVTQFTVLSSILSPELRRRIALEMIRVLRPGGVVLSYDLRVPNPRNPNVCAISASEVRRLFPGRRIGLTSVTLAPPLARAIVPRCWTGGLILEQIPCLRTHYVAAIHRDTEKPSTRPSNA